MSARSSTGDDARSSALPGLSRRAGFWAVALAFFTATAFSTAPSSLYGLYEQSLLTGRVLTGVAVGAVVATATAFITDLDSGPTGAPTRRAGIVGTIANIGGLASGPLIAGVLARYAPHGLTLPYQVFLVALVLAMVGVAAAPEGHQPARPRPRYRPQRLAVPAQARRQFTAAVAGGFQCSLSLGCSPGLRALSWPGRCATRPPPYAV